MAQARRPAVELAGPRWVYRFFPTDNGIWEHSVASLLVLLVICYCRADAIGAGVWREACRKSPID